MRYYEFVLYDVVREQYALPIFAVNKKDMARSLKKEFGDFEALAKDFVIGCTGLFDTSTGEYVEGFADGFLPMPVADFIKECE